MSDAREAQLRSLRWSLQALAVGPTEQLALFPEYARTADELALDFENWSSAVRESDEADLSGEQIAALAELDRRLHVMSTGDPDVWSPVALAEDPQWVEIRRLASEALAAFGWALESPPRHPADRDSTFVR